MEDVLALRDRTSRLVAIGLIAFGFMPSACAPPRGDDASPTPVPLGSAVAQECYGINESVDTPPLTIAFLMDFATAVVVAEVKAIEGGRFNTKDGSGPKPGDRPGPNSEIGVVTPINLKVTRWIHGDSDRGALRVVVPGGKAGCIEHSVNPAPHVEKGATYVLFLQPSPDADGDRHPELPLVLAAWPVGADGSVATEHDGTMSVDALAATVASPAPPSATPEGP